MRNILILLFVMLLASPALASHQPQLSVKSTCQCKDCVGCDPANCTCPKIVQFPNGATAVLVPDKRGRWPYQGPFRWIGAAGRFGLGLPPRMR